jgi:surface polysaccharide O-acyltransferase-like enzyme
MRIQSIDTFKGLAILAVVIIHTEPFFAAGLIKNDWYYLGQSIQQISSFAVPFFFVAAGYFFSRGMKNEGAMGRWWLTIKRLSVPLMIWIIIDGIFWGQWLEKIYETKSLAPLLWNLIAIPTFAAKRPDLFLLRGTEVSLWFLISLIFSISLLTICIRQKVRPGALLAIGFCGYYFSLITSFYSGTPLGIGLTLPLEQRGPFIAFLFLAIGHFLAVHEVSVRLSALVLTASILMVFIESAALSYFAGLPFQEKPYLFSTILFATSVLLFALNNPSFGADSLLSKIGNRSLGIYLVHPPLVAVLDAVRGAFIHPVWEVLFPMAVLAISYAIVISLMKVPYIRSSVS